MKAGLQQKRFQTIKAGLSPEVRPRSVSCTPGTVGRAGQPPPQGTGKEPRRYGCGRGVLSTPICKGVFFLFQQIMKIETKKNLPILGPPRKELAELEEGSHLCLPAAGSLEVTPEGRIWQASRQEGDISTQQVYPAVKTPS